MTVRYSHVLRAIYGRPWAVLPSTLDLICEIVDFRAAGGVLSEEEIQQRIASASNGPRTGGRGGAVAVIPVYGVISQRAGLMSRSSGGTSVEGITGAFREALADGDVSSIVFDVDSPGGTVDGIEELATEIRAARGQKPIAAVANTMIASAAYWIASAADEVVATPSGQIGSIGVIAAHVDDTKAREIAGITRTVISNPAAKSDGFDGDTISAEGVGEIQSAVDQFYAMFTQAVAKGRGVSIETVRADYGGGRMLLSKPALAAGMVDRIDTLDNTIRRAARGRIAPRGQEQVENAALASLDTDPEEPLEDPSLPNDDDLAVALDAGLPFGEHLALVAAQLDALVVHARAHMDMRAKAGRSPSRASSEQLDHLRGRHAELVALLDRPGQDAHAAARARAIAASARIRSARLLSPALSTRN